MTTIASCSLSLASDKKCVFFLPVGHPTANTRLSATRRQKEGTMGWMTNHRGLSNHVQNDNLAFALFIVELLVTALFSLFVLLPIVGVLILWEKLTGKTVNPEDS